MSDGARTGARRVTAGRRGGTRQCYAPLPEDVAGGAPLAIPLDFPANHALRGRLLHPDPAIVAIVLDPDYGQGLRSLVARAGVWVVESPANRPVIEALWNERRHERAPHDVTLFRWIDGLSAADHVEGVLRSVRNAASSGGESAPWADIEVVGAQADEEMLRALERHGLRIARITAEGFRASVPDPAA